MIKNYFKIALRNILRHKAYSALNISALAIGMACSVLILLWVQDEKSYDRFNANAAHLYRLTSNVGDFKAAVSPAGMGEGLQKEMPSIKAAVRLRKQAGMLFSVGEKKFEENKVFFADSNFLQVFSYKLIEGNAASALQQPGTVLITKAVAKKYFGTEEALGKVIKRENNENCTVTGVLADVPSNSHLQFDFILPIASIQQTDNDLKTKTWDNFNYYTYLLLDKNVKSSPATFRQLIPQIQRIFKAHNPDLAVEFQLQSLTDIHLYSDLQIDLPGKGNKQYVETFFWVAIFILIVACINFMNLATARSERRAKEVGLRKVVGAGRSQLIFQFLGEAVIISFLSLPVAIAIIYAVMPLFNQLAEKQLGMQIIEGKVILSLIGLALFSGIVSGSYPALYMSGLKPVRILKGKFTTGSNSLLFRNGLVVFQFVITVILLTGSVVVYKQLHYIKNKELGFDKSNLLYVPMKGEIWGKQAALKDALGASSLTSNFSVISNLPTALTTGTENVRWQGKDPSKQIIIPSLDIDQHFTAVFKTKLIAGRSFSNDFKGDSSNYVINEQAMRVMGLNPSNVIGKPLSYGDTKGTIIGVMKDFNFKPLQYTIEPLIMRHNKYGGIVMIRTEAGQVEATVKQLQKIYKQLAPSYPFTFNFLDSDLANLYTSEQQMGRIFNLFVALAIFIACLGLYSLSAFMAEQRTKEIGVRKVLGASVINIIYLLATKFTRLVIVSVVIAVPLAWLAINNWLNGFAYHIDVSWGIFMVASLVVLFIAWFTVGYESIKAALANPVKSLRAE